MIRSTGLSRVLLGAAGLALLACAGNEPTTPRPPTEPSENLTAAAVNEFNVLTTVEDDKGFGVATAGAGTVLVGIQSAAAGLIKARTVGSTGTLGTLYSTGRQGDIPLVTYTGSMYLMTWVDHSEPACTPQPCFQLGNVWGVFLNTAGAAIGSPFAISDEDLVILLSGSAFGGGKNLVVYTAFDIVSMGVKMYGRFVSTGGVPGSAFVIANAIGNGALNNVATDGNDFLVTWFAGTSNELVKARLVHNNGTMEPITTVNNTPAPSDAGIGVAYNGGNYMVTWSDSTGLGESQVFGRLVTQAGVATGAKFTIDGNSGYQIGSGVVASGTGFFATWLVLTPDTVGSKVRGRFFNASGTPNGTAKNLFSFLTGTGKVAFATAPVVVGTNSYYFSVDRAKPGVNPLNFEQYSQYDLHGSVKTLTP